MESTELNRAIGHLRKQQSRNRSTALTVALGGLILVVSGIWTQHRVAEQISKTIEAFYDSPSIAIGIVSAVNPTIAVGRIGLFVGIFFILIGITRFFYPDPARTVLLALLDQSNLEGNDGPETTA